MEEIKRKKGLAYSSVRRMHSPLKLALKQAVTNGLISSNPTEKIRLPHHDTKPVKALTMDEQDKFIGFAKEMYPGELFILALATGLRRGELLALTWDDIDFEQGLLKVSKTLYRATNYYDKETVGKLVAGTPKTKSSYRTVPLLPDMAQMLKNIRETQLERMQKYGSAYEDNNLIFCGYEGRPTNPKCVESRMARLADKMNMKGLHTHCLRHTFATPMYDKRKNPCKIKVFQRQKWSSMPKVCLLGFYPVKAIKDTSKNEFSECLF